MTSASPMIAPTVMRGLSEANGSWKMICMSRRSARSSSLVERGDVLRRRTSTSPEVGSISRRMQRPVVDLPQPDSPTRPSVSPAVEVEADAVDRMHARRPCATSRPPLTGKCFDQIADAQQRFASSAMLLGTDAGDLVAAARSRAAAASPPCSRRWRSGSAARSGSPAAGRAGSAPCRRSPRAAASVAARSMRGIERISPCV